MVRGGDDVRQPRGNENGFVVSIVAAKAGSQEAIGFIDDERGWRPYHKYNVEFLASRHKRTLAEARSVIDMAVEQLLVVRLTRMWSCSWMRWSAAGSGTD